MVRVREFWTWLKRILLALALAGLAPAAATPASEPAPAPTPAPASPREPRPAIWLLEDDDTKIYLFGTVHIFPASLRWRSAALDRIIAEADELVLETPDAADPAAAAERLARPMRMGKAVPILERVSPAARAPLAALIEATGTPIEAYDELHTWAVGFLLTSFMINQSAGGTESAGATSGAEEVLSQLFRKTRRPISGVETVEDQLRVFSDLPIGAQRRFLESMVGVGDMAAPEAPADDGNAAWVNGDVEAIATEMRAMHPELYEPMLTRRNRNWTQWLARRLERPGTVLFAVGAGHLAGSDSVQAMLAQRGLTARRIH